MYLADYHLHTRHSPDSKMTVLELARAAAQAGLAEVCVTDHTDIGHPEIPEDRPSDMRAFFAEIAEAREAVPGLVIRAGIEMGDDPAHRAEILAWHDAQPLDFRLLSVHLVDGLEPWLQKFYEKGTQDALYRRYLEVQLESLLWWPAEAYDAVAHLGYVAKFAPYPKETRAVRYDHGADLIDAILRRLAENGKALEINTSGYAGCGEPFPGETILRRFRALGGELITTGSDAHDPGRVGDGIARARALAIRCGFRYGATFEGRKLKAVPLE